MSAPVDVRAWLANKVTREREIERATGLPNSARAAAESVCAAIDELIEASTRMLPRNVYLWNTSIPDRTEIPLQATMGELRAFALALARASGAGTAQATEEQPS